MYLADYNTQELPNEHDAVGVEHLKIAPIKLDDLKAKVQDELREVNLGTIEDPRVT